jgi:hypothetical protein
MFDKFFAYLDRINHYLAIGLFDVKDVYPLKYWLDQIKASRYTSPEDNVFMPFIDFYGYHGVRALMKKFDNEEEMMAAGMKARPN